LDIGDFTGNWLTKSGGFTGNQVKTMRRFYRKLDWNN